MMQKVRGYLCFSNKEKKDVEYVFKNFRWDEAIFKIFSSYNYNNKLIKDPGVFFSGWINKKYTSENVVRLLKRLMAVDVAAIRYSVSLENENIIEFQDDFTKVDGYYCSLIFKERPTKRKLEKIIDIVNDKDTFNLCHREGTGFKHSEYVVDFFVDFFGVFSDILEELRSEDIRAVNTMFL